MKRIIKLSFILSALFIAAPLWMDAGKQLDFEAVLNLIVARLEQYFPNPDG